MNFAIALVPGDGIGPEVTGEATKVLDRIGKIYRHDFVFQEADAGGVAVDRHGDPLPADTVTICKKSDGVLLGAVGGPKWDGLPQDKRPERAILGLREQLRLYANLRPAILYDELAEACPLRADIAAGGIDIMVVRELTGGIYFGERGRRNTPMGETAWDTERYAYEEVKRIAVSAFEIAMQRGKHVTSVDKANVLETSRLWRSVVIETAKAYPSVRLDHMYVDNAAMQLVREPGFFDVLLTSNLFGDILSDEAAQITGSIGLLPSASMGGSGGGLYEPIHGSAPDIAGKGVANPIASILSAAMMLRYSFKLEPEAAAVERAVGEALRSGLRTADIAPAGTSPCGTAQMGAAIAENVK